MRRRGRGSLSRRLQAMDPPAASLVPEDEGNPLARPNPSALTGRASSMGSGALPRAALKSGGRGDAEFSWHALEIVEAPNSPIHWQVVVALLALFASAFAWAYFGKMAVYATASGKIQAAGRTKVLEPLDKGQVTKILVHDGDKVAANDVLVELDPTTAKAQRTIIFDKLTDLRAESLRETTANKAARATPIDTAIKVPWGADVPAAVRMREEGVLRTQLAQLSSSIVTLQSQRTAKEAERDKDTKTIAAQKELVAVTQENLTMIQSLLDKGFNSRAKYLDMKAQIDQQQVALTGFEGDLADAQQAIVLIDTEIAKTRETFVTTNTQAVVDAEQTIVDLAQQLVRADQTLTNMTLRSPVGGTIHASAVTTIGQVVKEGQQLMQIVPADSPLEIQAYVDNTDIGFIKVGQFATIKLTSFTYGTYGSIDGTVTSVARDALAADGKNTVQSASLDGEYRSTTAAQKTGSLQFPVTIRAARSSIRVEGKDIPLVPGMTVSVELETEQRPGLDYIVSPLLELFSTAAHEK